MRSPFPGMDPYIEAYGPWEDFHDDLVIHIKSAVADVLPDRYVVLAGERNYIEYVDPAEGVAERQVVKPDVGVLSPRSHSETTSAKLSGDSAGVAVAEPPDAIVMHGLIEVEHREVFLEILELDPERRLVTCIEVLSPTNKRFGSSGWHEYQRKRRVFLSGHANLVEIDLLRGGRRMPMEEPWPASPYWLAVVRKQEAPRMTVVPAHFMRPLPSVAIPLVPPDADIQLDLQPLVDAIYARSRYHRLLEYRRPLRPSLTDAETAWLEQRLRERLGTA